MSKQQNKTSEVYSTSGFKDTLASPVFYPVIVVAIVLGVTSIFGFVQNPLKLKTMVNVIHQKVADTKLVNDSLQNGLYSITAQKPSKENITIKQSSKMIELFSKLDEQAPEKIAIEGNFERIAFNYDVTSERFWADLDSSKFESAAEEMERKEKEAATFGLPLEIEYQDNFPASLEANDDSIYALNQDRDS